MVRLLIGLALMPSSALMLAAAARALGALFSRAPSAFPFLGGLALSIVAWLFGRFCVVGEGGPSSWFGVVSKKLYIFGHELTHALAAWSVGAKVLGFKVGDSGGHVDLSHSNAFIALAPYCVPIYTVLVIAGYRALLWLKPQAGGQLVFLTLVGLTLSFHMIKTFECLWDRRQPDLSAAGGVIFSLSWIVLANGLVMLVLLKTLFPTAVALSGDLQDVAARTAGFWAWVYAGLKPIQQSFVSQLRR